MAVREPAKCPNSSYYILVASYDCFPNDLYSSLVISEERRTSLVRHYVEIFDDQFGTRGCSGVGELPVLTVEVSS